MSKREGHTPSVFIVLQAISLLCFGSSKNFYELAINGDSGTKKCHAFRI